jgi:hypothetical protein
MYNFTHLTFSQSAALLAIADAFLPALTAEEIKSARGTINKTVINQLTDKIEQFLTLSARDDSNFVRYLDWALGRLPEKANADLAKFLDLIQYVSQQSCRLFYAPIRFPVEAVKERENQLLTSF